MSATRRIGKKQSDAATDSLNSAGDEHKRNDAVDNDPFPDDLSNDIKGLMSALHHIKERAQKDGQKKKEETISNVASEINSMVDELRAKVEKDRQHFAKLLLKSSKECESALKEEYEKFQAVFERFNKEKSVQLQAIKDTIARYEEEKEKLVARYQQLRKKEKSAMLENEKACADKIVQLEDSLKKKQVRMLLVQYPLSFFIPSVTGYSYQFTFTVTQDDRTFSFLKKTLGSFLDTASDEDFGA